MISVVCWLWQDSTAQPVELKMPPAPTLRIDLQPRRRRGDPRPVIVKPTPVPRVEARTFKPEHVNVMQRMFARHLPQKHRFICIADKPDGLAPEVEFVQTPAAAAAIAALRSPEGSRFPSCYRRLWAFSKEAQVLGERILVLDIDLVLTGDVTPIVDRQEDFVGWRPFRDWGRRLRFGGGSYLMTTGSRSHVWESFKGQSSIMAARAAGFRGSDQAWISYKLAEKEPYWDKKSGLYSVRDLGPNMDLPKDARLVQFNGNRKPWHYRHGWVLSHWR